MLAQFHRAGPGGRSRRARRGERADDSRQLTAGSEETTVIRKPPRTQSSQREITLLDLLCVLCGAHSGRILDLNIERQNKEPQNDEVVTSIFEIPCSIFCGLKTNDSGPKSEVGGRRTDNESWGSIVIRSLSFVVTGHGVERCGRSGDPRGTEKEGLSNVH